jgi:hypothetical protein
MDEQTAEQFCVSTSVCWTPGNDAVWGEFGTRDVPPAIS